MSETSVLSPKRASHFNSKFWCGDGFRLRKFWLRTTGMDFTTELEVSGSELTFQVAQMVIRQAQTKKMRRRDVELAPDWNFLIMEGKYANKVQNVLVSVQIPHPYR